MAELSEEDFVQERWKKDPGPLVFYLLVVLGAGLLLWGGMWWVGQQIGQVTQRHPFSQVTNRQMSLFLWQFPEFMRVHVARKSGYLPDFDYFERVGIKEGKADRTVVVPPEVLFRYHHWDRLLGEDVMERAVLREDFGKFLEQVPEWHPAYWKAAPERYREVVARLQKEEGETLEVPLHVRQAYLGWKNYFEEGKEINEAVFTYGEVESLLKGHPHYARNYWRNILMETNPDYLKDFFEGRYKAEEEVPGHQLNGMLRTALWNARQ